MNKLPLKKLSVATAVIVVLLGIIFFIFDLVTFRVTSMDPRNDSEVSDITDRITIRFNKNLDNTQEIADNIEMRPDHLFYNDAIIEGKTLTLTLGRLRQNTKYVIVLKNIKSTDGKVIESISTEFTTKYIPFNDLPKDLRERSIQTEESEIYSDPIFSITPYETTSYLITPVVVDEVGDVNDITERILLRIHIKLSSADSASDRSRYRQQAIRYLESKDIDPSKYSVSYTYDEVFGSAE